MPARTSRRFSRVHATFDDWLAARESRSDYVKGIQRRHARYPSATLSQLRRHPRRGQLPLGKVNRAPVHTLPFSGLSERERIRRQRALSVLSEVRRGEGSLTARARARGTTRDAVRRATGAFRKKRGRWVPIRRDRVERWLKSYERGRRTEVLVNDSRIATLLSRYGHAVNEYLVTRDPEILRAFRGLTYRDAWGKQHAVETDSDAVLAAVERSESDFGAFVDLYSEPEEAAGSV